MRPIRYIKLWTVDAFHVWRRELQLSMSDGGVVIFFLLVCAVYPLLYALIYNTETAHDVPVVVVDDDRSQPSRHYVRMLDGTPEVAVVGYAANMQEAQTAMHEKRCYGIVHIDRDYSAALNRNEQAHVNVYTDRGVLLHYKQIVIATTNVQQQVWSEKQQAVLGAVTTGGAIIENEQVPLGNTAMGLASAVLPCILLLVLQQTMLLGIGMLHGGSRERRLQNRGIDPKEVPAGVGASIIGKAACYVLIYLVPTVYVLHLVPMIFDFPQNGRLGDILAMTLPFLIATAFMGQALKIFVNDRESTFITIAFTSVIFVFLTGISWPRASMAPWWIAVGNMIPGTWASNGYIAMQTGGATLKQIPLNYYMLWILVGFYFVVAYCVEHFLCRRRWKRMQYYAEKDPKSLMRVELRRQAVDIIDD